MWETTMRIFTRFVFLGLLGLAASGCGKSGPAQDEAKLAGKTPADFPHATEDYFRDMDGGMALTAAMDETTRESFVKGRNTWLVWTGGNEAFWDWLANNSFGTFDFLKVLSSYPCSEEQERYLEENGGYGGRGYGSGGENQEPLYRYYSRDTRFSYLGVINEPGFRKPTKPDEFGLCLDEGVAPPEPFDEEIYGRASGVLGLRLYPNPNFDAKARARWDANRFYNDPSYFYRTDLVRPYRVGMSCAFCHVSPHPLYPPVEPENPQWQNLSGTIGAQYFWFGRIFGPNARPDNFVWQLLDTQQPGAVDTSFIPADNLNNPRAMNAVFDVLARLEAAQRFHVETITGGALDLPEVQARGPKFGVPHILWDGADSVGIDAALTRVYINIGEYHQEWIRHFRPIVGGQAQTPIEVKVAQENSVYWNATQERAPDMAAYLIHAGGPMYLRDVPGSETYLQGDRSDAEYQGILTRGKVVFAENCARCHSSKIPSPAPGLDEEDCTGPDYLDCWKRYWEWTETEEFKQQMTERVLAEDFLQDNYLSTDARIPVHQPLIPWQPDPAAETPGSVRDRYLERARQRGLATGALETEICSSMASNAIEGHVWDNFSSASYKSLPAVGDVELYDPIHDRTFTWSTPGGGRGYQRVPSLIAVWATAPYLHTNEVGKFTGDPSLDGRMEAFDDAIRKLLWPERREHIVHRTDQVTDIVVPIYVLPGLVRPLLGQSFFARYIRWTLGLGWLVSGDEVRIGPIPQGTPVNLLSNVNLDPDDPRVSTWRLLKLVLKGWHNFKRIHDQKLGEEEAALLTEMVPELLELSACPDFIVDRGHYFGTHLPDEDKEALIEFIKTL